MGQSPFDRVTNAQLARNQRERYAQYQRIIRGNSVPDNVEVSARGRGKLPMISGMGKMKRGRVKPQRPNGGEDFGYGFP